MRAVGGSVTKGSDDPFMVQELLQTFADDIWVALATVENRRAGRGGCEFCVWGPRGRRGMPADRGHQHTSP